MKIDRDSERELIAACNLICRFVEGRLAEGWEIRLTMTRGDAFIDLIDPDGNDVEIESPDWGISTISEMCDVSNERAI